MKTRSALLIILTALLCTSCGRRPKRPNVVLFTWDTVRQDHLGCYGYENANTPVVDALAAEGVVFEDAYCQVPITLPSHASILTGFYPPRHGLRLNGNYFLHPDIETLPAMLKQNGYMTAAFVSSFVLDSQFGLNRGFDVYDDELFGGPWPNRPERPAGATAEKAIKWLREEAKGPFFLWVHLFDPHAPYIPPEPYATEFADAPYDGEIAYTDECTGRILKTLETMGFKDSTLVIVMADHGEGLGDHGELTHSFFIYDTTMKVPLVMRLPAVRPGDVPLWEPGARVSEFAQSVDVVPTILQLVGIESAADFDGVSLASEQKGEPLGYGESLYPLSFGWSPLHSTRTPAWKYIHAPHAELYDMDMDPGEFDNLYKRETTIAGDLDDRLRNYLENVEGPTASDEVVDPETLSRLRSLGYLGSSTVPSEEYGLTDLPNPKDRLNVFDKINEARALSADGEPRKSIKLLRRYAKKQEKNNPVLLEVLGQAYELEKNYDKAIEYYGRFRDLDPQNLEASGQLASIYLLEAKPQEALGLLNPCIEKMPTYAAAWDMIGVANGMLGHGQKASDAGRQAVKLQPMNPDFQKNFGVSLMNFNQPGQAEERFLVALDIVDEETADLLYHVALSLHKQNRFPEALTYYQRVLEIDPEHPQAKQVVDEVRK